MPPVTTEALSRDNLQFGDDYITETCTVVSGAGVVARGTLVGLITASGKVKTSLTGSSDGSQTAYGILAETVDATSSDQPASVYLFGEFNQDAITLGASWTIALAKPALRDVGIYIKPITK